MVGVQRKGRRFNGRGKEGVERGDWELSGGRKNIKIMLSLAQDEAFLLCAWTSKEEMAGVIGMKE